MDLLIDEYGLRTLPKRKPVISLDDLYLLRYTHWLLDDATYTDEQQRVQVATGILAAVLFGCRPCSLFDTGVKFNNADDLDKPFDTTAAVNAMNNWQGPGRVKINRRHRKKCHKEDTVMPIDSGRDFDDGNTKAATQQ